MTNGKPKSFFHNVKKDIMAAPAIQIVRTSQIEKPVINTVGVAMAVVYHSFYRHIVMVYFNKWL